MPVAQCFILYKKERFWAFYISTSGGNCIITDTSFVLKLHFFYNFDSLLLKKNMEYCQFGRQHLIRADWTNFDVFIGELLQEI